MKPAPVRRAALAASLALLAAFAASVALLAALAVAPPRASAATRLFIRNHVNSNDVRGLAPWQGSLAAATTGGLVTVSMPAGPLAKTIASPDGLPSNHALCVVASPSGDLWIGTADAGVARLTPAGTWRRTLTTFDGLPSDGAQAFLRLGDSIWVGTTGGVALFTETPGNARIALRRSDTSASTAGGLVSDDVRSLAQSIGDTLWAGTSGGLAAFAAGAWTDRRALFAAPVTALLSVGDTLWIGAGSGPRPYAGGVLGGVDPGFFGTTLALASWNGTVVAGGGGGVFRRVGSAWVATGPGLPFGIVNTLGTAPDGALWAGTQTGLARYDAASDRWTAYRTEGPDVPSTEKTAVRDAEAWFTTGNATAPGLGAGIVLHTDGVHWLDLTSDSTRGALQKSSVFGILVSRDQKLWFGHCCGSATPQPRVERYDPATGAWDYPGPTNLWCFAQAPGGRVYGGSVEYGNGVYVFDPVSAAVLDSLTPSNTAGSARGFGLSSNNLRAIAFDPAGVAWIATADNGVDRWDGRGTDVHADDFWDHYSTGFPSSKTTSLAVLDTATVYVGTQAGVAVLVRGFMNVARKDAINGAIGAVVVQDLAHDPRRVVWIGTNAGLARFDDVSMEVERFTTTDGLVSDDVHGLAWDEARGILWVATSDGVSEIHPQTGGAPALGADVYAYPNPAAPGQGGVRIGGLAGAVTGEVRDVAGNLVRSFRADPVANTVWDLSDASGRPAAPGIYLIVLRDATRVRTLRVAVTR
ncbi:MAG: hypothetical protein ACM3PF_14655 [Bacteroidota bacterium]